MSATNASHPVIVFDGVCNLCNGFVQFVIRHDATEAFHFGALQSPKAQQLLTHFNLQDTHLKTIILIQNNTAFTQSTAVLKIAKQLRGVWQLFYVFIIIPKPIRDWVYKVVSRNRYRVFGKRDTCIVPTPELKSRFID
jgi:predicted DCC family thiol-disulfide oxidoreductase YuxK